jgi:parallel beta-helix repeat protein
MKKTILIFFLFILIINIQVEGLITTKYSLSVKNTVTTNNFYEDYTDNNGRIIIENEEALANSNAVRYGSGTKNDPYVIENWKVKEINISYILTVYLKIQSCYITGKEGIYFFRVANCQINNCLVKSDNCYKGIGMRLSMSNNNIVDNCIIQDHEYSIYLFSFSAYNIIKNCEISHFQEDGISIRPSSHDNEISYCKISDSFYSSGIRLEDTYSNIIHNCDISYCYIGFYGLKGCINNIFYQNNLFENRKYNYKFDMVDGVNSNMWYNEDLKQGNYWDDFDEPREGARDDNRDGIVDSSYTLGNNNVDNYPLIDKYGTPTPPSVTGLVKGQYCKTHTYNFTTYDPDNDQIYFYIDWGDNTPVKAYGPYSSNIENKIKHTWLIPDKYTIKAKAIDDNNFESDWGLPLEIVMSQGKSLNKMFLPNFFEKLKTITRFCIS